MKSGWDSRAGKKGLLSRVGSSGCISLIENGLADVGELIRGVQALYGGEISGPIAALKFRSQVWKAVRRKSRCEEALEVRRRRVIRRRTGVIRRRT